MGVAAAPLLAGDARESVRHLRPKSVEARAAVENKSDGGSLFGAPRDLERWNVRGFNNRNQLQLRGKTMPRAGSVLRNTKGDSILLVISITRDWASVHEIGGTHLPDIFEDLVLVGWQARA